MEIRMIILEIEKLESEAKCLGSTDAETEAVLSELKEEIEALLENLKVSENKSADAQRKAEEIEILQKESDSNQLRLNSLSKEVNQLQCVIEEEELLINQCKENEKKLDQKQRFMNMDIGQGFMSIIDLLALIKYEQHCRKRSY
ncbi:hypothetical protein Bca52824_027424 [Brassica carinata]|uniref:Uncharacterized protein n=1 Tax=Brassica carinata TaxID=52824 RepID=A0A8X7SJD8_BRACI|nr:hypothetical protein Bca52824_027424 [Brassica carinata]